VYLLIYTRTYARAGPYLIGIALGYLLHALKNRQINIPMVSYESDSVLGWTCSTRRVSFNVDRALVTWTFPVKIK